MKQKNNTESSKHGEIKLYLSVNKHEPSENQYFQFSNVIIVINQKFF